MAPLGLSNIININTEFDSKNIAPGQIALTRNFTVRAPVELLGDRRYQNDNYFHQTIIKSIPSKFDLISQHNGKEIFAY